MPPDVCCPGLFFSQRMRMAAFPPEWSPCLNSSAQVWPGPWGHMGLNHPWGTRETSSFWMRVATVKTISCEWMPALCVTLWELTPESEVELLPWVFSPCKSCQSAITQFGMGKTARVRWWSGSVRQSSRLTPLSSASGRDCQNNASSRPSIPVGASIVGAAGCAHLPVPSVGQGSSDCTDPQGLVVHGSLWTSLYVYGQLCRRTHVTHGICF